jgi:tRNA modification GTPase
LAFADQAQPGLPGLRRAMPGEFTQRAFLNQKMDLAQAEAVADLIDAQTHAAGRGAGRSLAGEFSHAVANIQGHLLRLRVLVEASLDFPDEDIDFVTQADVGGQLVRITQALKLLCGKAEQGALLRDGMKLVIAGQPNAGKSSLLNALTGQEVAIVTPIAGTTRDVLTQEIAIEGVPVHVVDTAGLRQGETPDEVETIGIARAWAQVGNADVVVLLHDLARLHEAAYMGKQNDLTAQVMQRKQARSVLLHVFNKADIANPNTPHPQDKGIFISAKTGQGLQELKQQLLQSVGWQASHQEGVFSARARHVQALEKAQLHTEQALACLQQPTPALDLLAEELRCAQQHLSELTGAMSADDLLGEIFSNFCIGK